MIFFRVTNNINIKATDGTLIKYLKLKGPANLNNETVYITTYEDFEDLQEVFGNVDKEKYSAKLIKEEKIRSLEDFPIELGIPNAFEHFNYSNFKNEIKDHIINDVDEVKSLFQSTAKVDIYKQLKNLDKDEISLAIIGAVGKSIGEMVASSTAVRILHSKLKEVYKKINIDIYLDASNNSFYSRDKQIFQDQDFIREVFPLSLNVKKFCTYDYFIDNSSVMTKSSYFKELNCIDAWLHKFGIDYERVPNNLKYNELHLKDYEPDETLLKKLNDAKQRGKLLLFHPYSANIQKSIPQMAALKILKKLLEKLEGYTIVTTIKVDPKFDDIRVLDLSKESKTFNDFSFIVSNMDAIVSSQTSTYHISDAFMIPTVVIFTKTNILKEIKYYRYVKSIEIEDESKNYSHFIFDNDELTFYKFSSWEKLKVSKIIKLLESF